MSEDQATVTAAQTAPTTTALVRRSQWEQVHDLVAYLDDLDALANALCKSTMLPREMQTPANLKLVLLQGLSMGFDPIQAIRGSYVITSKDQPPRVGYYVEALVALVRTSSVCRFFRVEEATAERCRVVCARTDEDETMLHIFELTMAQAQAANLDKKWEKGSDGKYHPETKYTWKAAPADMLRNRTCGRAVKSVFQDVVFGMSTPDELDDIAAADAMERSAGGGFAPAPVAARPAPSSAPAAAAARPAEDIVDAELVGSGDAAWDELLALIGLAGVDTAGWLPADLCEEWDRRVAGTTSKGALNAFAPWIGEATKRAQASKSCAEVAAHMRASFNAQNAELGKRAKGAAT